MGLEVPTLSVRSAVDSGQADTKSFGTRVKGKCHHRPGQGQVPGSRGGWALAPSWAPMLVKSENSGRWGLSCWHGPPLLPAGECGEVPM